MIRTADQLLAWCAGAAEELGDPSAAVGQMFVRWENALGSYRGEDLVCGLLAGELVLALGPSVPPVPLWLQSGPPVIEAGELKAFGARFVTHGVWALEPSLSLPGFIHAFVVLYDVPMPAPWERRILLPPGVEVAA